MNQLDELYFPNCYKAQNVVCKANRHTLMKNVLTFLTVIVIFLSCKDNHNSQDSLYQFKHPTDTTFKKEIPTTGYSYKSDKFKEKKFDDIKKYGAGDVLTLAKIFCKLSGNENFLFDKVSIY